MTTLLSWMSVDNRGPSAVYIVADSRITWGSAKHRWDSGGKVFASKTADILGYCGDVVFPSVVLAQLTDLASREILWGSQADATARHMVMVDYLKTSFSRRHDAPDQDFTIIHAARDGKKMASEFQGWRTDYSSKNRSWHDAKLDTSHDGRSKVLIQIGSGAKSLKNEITNWNNSPQGGTARALFSAFCDSLSGGADPFSGGVPQVASLDRQSAGKIVGFVHEGTRYLHGLPISYSPTLVSLDWVDELFQRISPETLQLLSNAQRHGRVPNATKGGFRDFISRTEVDRGAS